LVASVTTSIPNRISASDRTDVKQFERLGGNECDHLAIGLWAAQLR
jgi:hypothetical protein